MNELMNYAAYLYFWCLLTEAEIYDGETIKQTANELIVKNKKNVERFTALVVALNHKIWFHWDAKNKDYAGAYDEVWRSADRYAYNHFKGDDLSYYFHVTD